MFAGDPNLRVSSIDSLSITLSRSSGQAPAFVQMYGLASVTGYFVDEAGNQITGITDLREIETIEYKWSINDANGTEMFTSPFDGKLYNLANSGLSSPMWTYCFRTASATAYTITCTARAIKTDGTLITKTATASFTASAFDASGGEYWADSNSPASYDGLAPYYDGTHGPFKTAADITTGFPSTKINVALHLARGSSWSASAIFAIGDASGVRIDDYVSHYNSSTAKPVISCNGGSNAPFWLQSGANHSDVVFSNLDLRSEGNATSDASPFKLNVQAGNTAADIWLDNCSTTAAQSGAKQSIYMYGGSGTGSARADFTRCGVYGGTHTNNQGSGFVIAYGPYEWGSWIGAKVVGIGPGGILTHFINPESSSAPLMAMFCSTNGGSMNFCFHPRAPAFGCAAAKGYISGPTLTITSGSVSTAGMDVNGNDGAGNYVTPFTKITGGSGPYTVSPSQNIGSSGSPIDIWTGDFASAASLPCVTTDCLWQDAVNGSGFANEQNWNPYGCGDPTAFNGTHATGYHHNEITQRTKFIGLSSNAFYPTSLLRATYRDCLISTVGVRVFNPQIGTVSGAGESGGLAAFLSALCYRNKIYRDASAGDNSNEIINLFKSGTTITQYHFFTDNIYVDMRNGANARIFASVMSALTSVGTVVGRNSYYTPNGDGDFIVDGSTAETLATFQGQGFDLDAFDQFNPKWQNPGSGNFGGYVPLHVILT